MDIDGDRHLREALRQALKHLYDPAVLRQNPLLVAFGLQGRPNAAGELREVLEQGIEGLRLDAGSPPAPMARRRWEVLFYSFVRQFWQRDVASQMGISPRHVRREQLVAIDALAERLRAKLVLDGEPMGPGPGPAANGQDTAWMTQEMVWLGDALAHSMTEMGTTLQEAIALARTVADQHGVGLELSLSDASTTVAVAQTVLKQIVLNLLTTAIHMAPAGQVTV